MITIKTGLKPKLINNPVEIVNSHSLGMLNPSKSVIIGTSVLKYQFNSQIIKHPAIIHLIDNNNSNHNNQIIIVTSNHNSTKHSSNTSRNNRGIVSSRDLHHRPIRQ